MNASDIQAIVQRQRAYFATGATRPGERRGEIVPRREDAIRLRGDGINAALQADLNKPPMESYMTETGMVLSEIAFLRKHTAAWARPTQVPTPMAQFPARSFILKEPYGVALIMSPWNYPIQLTLEPLAGAVAAGNCAVVKPSAYTPRTSRVLAELIASVFPPEYVTVVEGGRAENSALLEEPFDYIFFTGSVSVGKLVMEKASKHLTPVSLELGGKSPVLIDETANIPLTARRVAFGKCLNAGQTCVAPDYVLIHRSVKESFLSEYRKTVASFFPDGDYSNMPVIVNDKHFQRLMGLMEGETAALGGVADPQRRFIPPTVLDEVSWDAPVMQEEIFGPILPVLTYTDLEEAMAAIARRPKPLALYLFTRNPAVERKVLGRLSFGGGCVNDTIIHLATSHMGFGGVGSSGMGSYHGKRSFMTFSHEKSIVKKSTLLDLPMRYRPYTKTRERLVRMFLK